MKHTLIAILLLAALPLWAQSPAKSAKPSAPQQLTVSEGSLDQALSADSELLADAVQYSIRYLLTLPEGSYSLDEKPYIHQLLSDEKLPIRLSDLAQLKRVRSIQVENLGIFSYNYFKCRFTQRDSTLFFQKTSGSQRKSGQLYRLDDKRLLFLGGWTVNDDPLTEYGSTNSVAGILYRLASGKYIIVFPAPDGFEIYELAK